METISRSENSEFCPMRTITIDLFSGMGGFALAGHMMGWETAIMCEINPECHVVLKHHFPNAYLHGDIHTLTWKIINEEIEKRYGKGWRNSTRVVLCGGFPCQPFSAAGKRKGEDDDRFLWPQVVRLIEECRPHVVLLENVNGLASILEPAMYAEMEREAVKSIRGGDLLIEDEPSKREKVEIPFEVIQQRIMGRILQDIEAAGYETPKTADGCAIVLSIPACAVGAPHRRDRVWFVANSRLPEPQGRNEVEEGQQHGGWRIARGFLASLGSAWDVADAPKPGRKERLTDGGRENEKENGGGLFPEPERPCSESDATNANGLGLWGQSDGQGIAGQFGETCEGNFWSNFPTEWPLRIGDDGISSRLGRVRVPGSGKRITESGLNKITLKMAGNAVVPQVVFEIFKALEKTW